MKNCLPPSGRQNIEKVCFYDEISSELDLRSYSEIMCSLGDFNGHGGNCVEGFEGAHIENETGKSNWKEEDCWSSVM